MSILKIRRNEALTTDTAENIKQDFSTTIDLYLDAETVEDKKYQSIVLLDLYALYSYVYLSKIGFSFTADNGMKDTLTFMNSVIAEILHEMQIPYFHGELGYSVTDKAISYYIDGKEQLGFYDHIVEVMDEMMKPIIAEAQEQSQADAMIAEVEASLRDK